MKPENPPAFPTHFDACGDRGEQGMTLRDWFAGQALAGMAVHNIASVDCALMAFKTADAMLAERSKPDDV